MGLRSREEGGAVEAGRFGPRAAVAGAFVLFLSFSVIFLSGVVLLEKVGSLGGTGLPAAVLGSRGLGAAFTLVAPTAGCETRPRETLKINTSEPDIQWQRIMCVAYTSNIKMFKSSRNVAAVLVLPSQGCMAKGGNGFC